MEGQFKPTPANAAESLAGIHFPADRKKIVDYAREHQARQDVVEILEKMPDAQYSSMADVFQGFGTVR